MVFCSFELWWFSLSPIYSVWYMNTNINLFIEISSPHIAGIPSLTLSRVWLRPQWWQNSPKAVSAKSIAFRMTWSISPTPSISCRRNNLRHASVNLLFQIPSPQSSGTPSFILSRVEVQPQWLQKPLKAWRSKTSLCGAHFTMKPLSLNPWAVTQANLNQAVGQP